MRAQCPPILFQAYPVVKMLATPLVDSGAWPTVSPSKSVFRDYICAMTFVGTARETKWEGLRWQLKSWISLIGFGAKQNTYY